MSIALSVEEDPVAKNNVSKLKRDCLVAIFVPVLILGSFQSIFHTSSKLTLLLLAILGSVLLFQYVYRFLKKIDEMAWQDQLCNVIQKVSTPALIADVNHRIIYANDNFYRLGLAVLLRNLDNLIDILAVQENKLKDKTKETLDGLSGKVKYPFVWNGVSYVYVLVPLVSPKGKRWGTLLECQKVNITDVAIEHSESVSCNIEQKLDQAPQAEISLEHSVQALFVLNKAHEIVKINDNFYQYFFKDETKLRKTLLGESILKLLQEESPRIAKSLMLGLNKKEVTSFVVERNNQLCDWFVSPIKDNGKIQNYLIEIIYPSKQEMLALQESRERKIAKQAAIEKDLRQFTQGLANLRLYSKDKKLMEEVFTENQYHHPLLKNSSKLIQQLYSDLYDANEDFNKLKSNHEQFSLEKIQVLSNTLSQVITHDVSLLHQELSRLKNLFSEQQGLTQPYVQPLGKVFLTAEKFLLETVNFSETVTIISQQLHENQAVLSQLQSFIANSEKSLAANEEIIALLERIKNTLSINKLKLKDLLTNFEGLNIHWRQAKDNLNTSLHSCVAIEQATKRGNAMSHSAFNYSQHLQTRMEELLAITQEIQNKSLSPKKIERSSIDHFEQIAIDVDDLKKRAEDVLLEGWTKTG